MILKHLRLGHNPGHIHMEPLMKVRKEPLVANLPPLVMDASNATPRMINENMYTISSELPPPCKILYDTALSLIEWDRLDYAFEQCVLENPLSDLIR